MEKSFVARNFRLAFREEPHGINQASLDLAIENLEKEEVLLLAQQKGDIIRGIIEEPKNSKFFIRKTLVPILNYFEKIAICIDKEIVDEESIKEYFEDLFITYEKCFYRLIEIRRREYNGTDDAFKNYTELVKKWKN